LEGSLLWDKGITRSETTLNCCLLWPLIWASSSGNALVLELYTLDLFALYWKSITSWFNSGANLMCMQVKEIFLYCELNVTGMCICLWEVIFQAGWTFHYGYCNDKIFKMGNNETKLNRIISQESNKAKGSKMTNQALLPLCPRHRLKSNMLLNVAKR
jgi:hypothetical protein